MFLQLLDRPSLSPTFRPPFVNALLHLARKSELYPQILVRQDITFGEKYPVAAGQFGDVWKGLFNGREVAVKVLKLYLTTDISQHHKVGLIRTR